MGLFGFLKSPEEAFAQGKAFFDQKNYDKAFPLLTKAAKNGNAEAQYWMGEMYDVWISWGPEDPVQAFYWYEKAAQQNHVKAMYCCGFAYELGKGVKKDQEKAFFWYQKAMEQGNTRAIERCASMYYHGWGVAPDKKEAYRLYEILALDGDRFRQCECGKMCYEGDGIEKDLTAAFEWFKKAAKQDNVDSCHMLAKMYEKGEGTEIDLEKALSWYLKVAHATKEEGRYEDYSECTGAMLGCGRIYYGKQDFKNALYWFEKSAEKGLAEAQCWCGKMYLSGEGTKTNVEKGSQWYQKAAAKGNQEAIAFLAEMDKPSEKLYREAMDMLTKAGAGTTKNPQKEVWQKAVELLLQAAILGHTEAKLQCGVAMMDMYYADIPFAQRIDGFAEPAPRLAMKWFQQAAEDGNVRAMFNCGVLYHNFKTSAFDPSEREPLAAKSQGFHCFEKAMKLGYLPAKYTYGMYLIDGMFCGMQDYLFSYDHEIRGKSVLSELTQQDEDPKVRDAAKYVLKNLNQIHSNYYLWNEWWNKFTVIVR